MGKENRILIKAQWKWAFGAACIIGLITHLYVITHNFLTFDSMWNIYSDQDMISSGRPFLTYVCGISSYFNLPWVNGILSIFYLSLTGVVLVEVFGLKSKLSIVLISAILVTFPTIATTFAYIFTIDGYMLATLMAVLAVWVTHDKKWGWIIGGLFLCLSIGIYQANFAIAIVICILQLLLLVLQKESVKKIGIYALRSAFMGIFGYVFYVIALKIMLAVKGVTMSGYQGSDKVTSFEIGGIWSGVSAAYRSFFRFALYDHVLAPNLFAAIALVAVVLIGAGVCLLLFIKNGCYKKSLYILLVVVLVAAIPPGANVISVLSPEAFFHLLMRMPWAFLLMFPVVLADRYLLNRRWRREIWSKTAAWIIGIGSAVLVFSFFVVSNIAYFNMNEKYEKTYATCIRIVNRMEQTPGYHARMKVAILGGYPSLENYPDTDITREVLAGYFGPSGVLCVSDTDKFAAFFRHYLNVSITAIGLEEELKLAATKEFQEMPDFPAQGSIRIIGDVMVIRLNG